MALDLDQGGNMKRRSVISLPLWLGTRRAWNFLSNNMALSGKTEGEPSPQATDNENRIVIENSNHKLEFDRKSARLLSFRSTSATDQEFAVSTDSLPVFVIQ